MFIRTCLMICTLWISLSFWFQEQFLATGWQYRLCLGGEIFRVSMCNHPHQQKVSQRFQAEVEYQDESEEPQQWKCARIRQQHHIKQRVSMYSSTENNKGQMIRYAVSLDIVIRVQVRTLAMTLAPSLAMTASLKVRARK